MTVSDALSYPGLSISTLDEKVHSSWVKTSFFGERKQIRVGVQDNCAIRVSIVAQGALAHFLSWLLDRISGGYFKNFGIYPVKDFSMIAPEGIYDEKFRGDLIRHVKEVLAEIKTRAQIQAIIDDEGLLLDRIRNIFDMRAPVVPTLETILEVPEEVISIAPVDSQLPPPIAIVEDPPLPPPIIGATIQTLPILIDSVLPTVLPTPQPEPIPIKPIIKKSSLPVDIKIQVRKRPYSKAAIIGTVSFLALVALAGLKTLFQSAQDDHKQSDLDIPDDDIPEKGDPHSFPGVQNGIPFRPGPDLTQLPFPPGLHFVSSPDTLLVPFTQNDIPSEDYRQFWEEPENKILFDDLKKNARQSPSFPSFQKDAPNDTCYQYPVFPDPVTKSNIDPLIPSLDDFPSTNMDAASTGHPLLPYYLVLGAITLGLGAIAAWRARSSRKKAVSDRDPQKESVPSSEDGDSSRSPDLPPVTVESGDRDPAIDLSQLPDSQSSPAVVERAGSGDQEPESTASLTLLSDPQSSALPVSREGSDDSQPGGAYSSSASLTDTSMLELSHASLSGPQHLHPGPVADFTLACSSLPPSSSTFASVFSEEQPAHLSVASGEMTLLPYEGEIDHSVTFLTDMKGRAVDEEDEEDEPLAITFHFNEDEQYEHQIQEYYRRVVKSYQPIRMRRENEVIRLGNRYGKIVEILESSNDENLIELNDIRNGEIDRYAINLAKSLDNARKLIESPGVISMEHIEKIRTTFTNIRFFIKAIADFIYTCLENEIVREAVNKQGPLKMTKWAKKK